MHLESDHAVMCKYRDIDIGLLNTLTIALIVTPSAYMMCNTRTQLTSRMREKCNDVREYLWRRLKHLIITVALIYKDFCQINSTF